MIHLRRPVRSVGTNPVNGVGYQGALLTGRRISQLIFLGFFIYLIIRTVDPLTSAIPVNLWFISDPLVALGVSLATQHFLIDFLAAIPLVIITLLLGRVFCGWVCPLGTTLDVVDRLFLRRLKRTALSLRWRRVKYFLLVALIIAALFGINAIGWFDPISLAFKGYGLMLYSGFDWLGKKVLGGSDSVTTLVNLGILDRNNIIFTGSVILIGILLIILLLSLLEKRFWCRNLCPLGALFGLLSRWRLVKSHIGEDCSECRQCVKVCKMNARTEELVALDEDCIQCFTCVRNCPRKQIRVTHRKPIPRSAKSVVPPVSILPGRRGFLLSVLAGAAAVPLLKYTLPVVQAYRTYPRLRPPGAERSEEQFLAKCIRCGECMKVCPNNALHPLFGEGGLYGMFSPILIPRIGYCFYECNLCGQVCPTGAIKNLPLGDPEKSLPFTAKKTWKIGVAQTDWSICTRCFTCEEYCPVMPAKAIVRYHDIDSDLDYPWVNDLCIGCGTCENVCPVNPRPAICVLPLDKVS